MRIVVTIKQVPDVSAVTLLGGRRREVRIVLDAAKLAAYQMAPLSLAMPLINLVDVLVAVTIGVLVFHELPAHTPVLLGLQSGAVVCLGLGLREIARLADQPARSELITERTAS